MVPTTGTAIIFSNTISSPTRTEYPKQAYHSHLCKHRALRTLLNTIQLP